MSAHSEKENAAATFKRTFGYHPLGVWCDNTSELLAGDVAPGQRRVQHRHRPHRRPRRGDQPRFPAAHRRNLLVRADGAGASHDLLDWLTGLSTAQHVRRGRARGVLRRVRDHPRHCVTRSALVPEDGVDGRRSTPTVASVRAPTSPSSPACSTRHDAATRGRPGCGSSSAVNDPHPGRATVAVRSRTTGGATKRSHQHPAGQLAFLEARHRAHARVEDRIRARQGHRPGPVPVAGVRDQPGLADRRRVAADLTAWTPPARPARRRRS